MGQRTHLKNLQLTLICDTNRSVENMIAKNTDLRSNKCLTFLKSISAENLVMPQVLRLRSILPYTYYTMQPIHAYYTVQLIHAYYTMQPIHAYYTLQPIHAYYTMQPIHAYYTMLPIHAYYTMQPIHE
jgi:hypothetical protein